MLGRRADGLGFFRGVWNSLLFIACFVALGLAVAGEYRPLAMLLAATAGYFVGRGQAEHRPARAAALDARAAWAGAPAGDRRGAPALDGEGEAMSAAKHTSLSGNCWKNARRCNKCGKGELCDVCHKHDEPRGACSECDPCLACESEDADE